MARTKRPVGRHARVSRRFTPRRWLPFLALIAVVAGAVIVSRQDTVHHDGVTGVAPQSLLPVASPPSPVSSTWFCSGGSATDAKDPVADLSVVITNASPKGLRAIATFFGSSGEPHTERLEVPANDRVRLTAHDYVHADWAAATVEVFGGRATVERRVEGAQGFDTGPCSTTAAQQWYIPSGSTVRGAVERIALFNPFPDPTSVDIRFATDSGALSPQAAQGLSIPGRSLRVVTVDNPSRRSQVAATVSVRSGRIVVDRIQTYDGGGDPIAGQGADAVDTDAPKGLASTPAISALASRWFFPEARLVAAGRVQVAVQNPGDADAAVEIHVTYEDPARYPQVDPIDVSVGADGEALVDLTDNPDVIPGVPFSIDLVAADGRRVAAELLWFTGTQDAQAQAQDALVAAPDSSGTAETAPDGAAAPDAGASGEVNPDTGAPGEVNPDQAPPAGGADTVDVTAPVPLAQGFSVTAGTPVAARTWLVGGRGASPILDSRVVVANPGPRPVKVRVTEVVGGRHVAVKGSAVTIAGHDRRALGLRNANLTTGLIVTADGPIAVGRIIWSMDGAGTALSLATPFPETVEALPRS